MRREVHKQKELGTASDTVGIQCERRAHGPQATPGCPPCGHAVMLCVLRRRSAMLLYPSENIFEGFPLNMEVILSRR